MLAYLGLSLSRRLDQLLDRLPAISEQVQYLKPRWIGQCLAQVGLQAIKLLFSLAFHIASSRNIH
jgi:hypothetical protein